MIMMQAMSTSHRDNPAQRHRDAGQRLARAWLAAESLQAFPEALRARTRQDAYAIQDQMAAVIGQPVTGWKLGATSLARRARAGHDGAIIGRVFDSVTFESPAQLPIIRNRLCALCGSRKRALCRREGLPTEVADKA